VVVAAPDEPAPSSLLRELTAAMEPIEALGALTAGLGLGVPAPGLQAVAVGLVPAAREALAKGNHIPATLPDALAGLASLSTTEAQQRDYAGLALQAALSQAIRAERTLGLARLARVLPAATLAGLAQAIQRTHENAVWGARSKAAAVATLGERLAAEGRVDEALALVDLVTDPVQRFLAAHAIIGSLPGGEIDESWLMRPGRRTRSQWLADLAAVGSVQNGELPAAHIVRVSADCLSWWP
jgi:hypothetical protein